MPHSSSGKFRKKDHSFHHCGYLPRHLMHIDADINPLPLTSQLISRTFFLMEVSPHECIGH